MIDDEIAAEVRKQMAESDERVEMEVCKLEFERTMWLAASAALFIIAFNWALFGAIYWTTDNSIIGINATILPGIALVIAAGRCLNRAKMIRD
jgi:hypothetical protein